jgi:hypothetical protein
MDLTCKDFQPINRWKPDLEGPRWGYDAHQDPKFLIDQTTGKKYFNESKSCVRIKCLLLTVGVPVVHTVAAIINIAWKVLKLISFSHFWCENFDLEYKFKARLKAAGKDLLSIVTTPFFLVALELTAIYGLITPYNGRKLYASTERAYNTFTLAPCFRPDPTSHATVHAFGGDANKKDSF